VNREAVTEDVLRQLIEALRNAAHEHGWYEMSADLEHLARMVAREQTSDDELRAWRQIGHEMSHALNERKPIDEDVRRKIFGLLRGW